ncbi:uncharacterized protein PHACADRAFT_28220 [Phanerochaete carnosa HHB-10118-sp]|uniref:Uncharacterized protein n=1 Tax=Phanerochaete carnosa (strain HHB-10118-sp) TaxID=650164 RepID=K5WXE2_PHACS|nr:uncharacterized protein PHACADRAFT_28220 [Phanerochaete carnosa HHB-10118-sp]EKM55157.1 hypothetical protein PHACADRAFT_28220 [Phanerochaete carnosa HHB-10118-sp]
MNGTTSKPLQPLFHCKDPVLTHHRANWSPIKNERSSPSKNIAARPQTGRSTKTLAATDITCDTTRTAATGSLYSCANSHATPAARVAGQRDHSNSSIDEEQTPRQNATFDAAQSLRDRTSISWSPFPSARGRGLLSVLADSRKSEELQVLDDPRAVPRDSSHTPAGQTVQGSILGPTSATKRPPLSRFENENTRARSPSQPPQAPVLTPPAPRRRDSEARAPLFFFPAHMPPPPSGPSSAGSPYSYGPYNLDGRRSTRRARKTQDRKRIQAARGEYRA